MIPTDTADKHINN